MTLVIDDRRIVRLVGGDRQIVRLVGGDRFATFLELFPPFGGAIVLPKLTLTGSFTPQVEVSADQALPELTLSGSFTVAVAVSGALVLPELTFSGSFTVAVELGSGALALPELTLAGSFTVGVEVSGTLVLPELTLAGSFTVAVELGSSALALPELTLSGSPTPLVEVAGSLVLPELTLAGSFTVGVEVSGTLVLPELTLAGSFTVAVELGSSALALPELTLSGSPTPLVEVAGSLVLPELTLAGSFTVGVEVSGTLVLPELTLAGSFTVAVEVSGTLVLPELTLSGSWHYFTPADVPSLVAHWSGNGSTGASAANRIPGSSVGALVQATGADQPSIITTTNGVDALSFDGVTQDMSAPDVAALRFTGPRGYWAWHLRSVDTVPTEPPTRYLGGQHGGTSRLLSGVSGNWQPIVNLTALPTYGPLLAQLQAGCFIELLFDGNASSADSGLARLSLFCDGVQIGRLAASGTVPAALNAGDATDYWLGSLNGSSNKRVDIAHHYVGNDHPTAIERAALRTLEAPQWDTPNLYPSPVFVLAPSGVTGTAGASISVAWPAHQPNDIGLLIVESANVAASTPSGWTAVTNGSQGVGTADSTTATRVQVFWRRAASAAESAVVVTNPGNHLNGAILVFRGCISTGDPIDVSAGDDGGDVNATAVTIPGATTTVANCLIVAIAARQFSGSAGQQSGQTNASLTALTERFDAGQSLGNGGGFAVVTGDKATAGAYSATTATIANTSRQGRVSLALKPNP